VEHKKFEINFNSRYTGVFRTRAGFGPIPENERINSNFVLDLGCKYAISEHAVLTANILNLLNTTYAASRVPAGMRPGHPFGGYTGINLKF
jgi:Fe(3+) dicitrate transport protein